MDIDGNFTALNHRQSIIVNCSMFFCRHEEGTMYSTTGFRCFFSAGNSNLTIGRDSCILSILHQVKTGVCDGKLICNLEKVFV